MAGAAVPTGDVTFTLDGQPFATATINGSGVATATGAVGALGNHSIIASYGGDATVGPGVSAARTHEVVQAATAVTMDASSSSTVNGQPVTFTATVHPVAPSGGIPVGDVVFDDGDVTVTVPLDASGKATVIFDDLSSGDHRFDAAFLGSAEHGASRSAVMLHTVTKRPITLNVTVDAGPHIAGTNLTGTVEVTSNGDPVSVGQVRLFLDDVGRGAELVDGVGTFELPITRSGVRSLSVTYDGFMIYADVTLPDRDITVLAAPTTLRLDAPETSVRGVAPTLTATAAITGQTRVPVGTVTFRDGTTVLGTVPVDELGSAVLRPNGLGVGTHHFTASFSGDDLETSTSSTVAHEVVAAHTKTTVAASPGGSVAGQEVTFTATVVDTDDAAAIPTGTIVWTEGTNELARTPLTATGTAELRTAALTVGSHPITATYVATGDHGESQATRTHVVSKAPSQVALTANVARPVTGQMVTYTATVSVPAPGAAQPTGTVTFEGLSTTAVPVDAAGVANLTIATPYRAPQSAPFTARYSGDAVVEASSGTLAQRSSKRPQGPWPSRSTRRRSE